MSVIRMVTDVENAFLSRRELVCDFDGMGGKLGKLEAIGMVTQEFKLDGRLVIPMRLKNHVGKTHVTGTFFVYEDEKLARSHVNPTIFKRLERANTAAEKAKGETEKAKEPESDAAKAAEAEPAAESKPEESTKDEKTESKPESAETASKEPEKAEGESQ